MVQDVSWFVYKKGNPFLIGQNGVGKASILQDTTPPVAASLFDLSHSIRQ